MYGNLKHLKVRNLLRRLSSLLIRLNSRLEGRGWPGSFEGFFYIVILTITIRKKLFCMVHWQQEKFMNTAI